MVSLAPGIVNADCKGMEEHQGTEIYMPKFQCATSSSTVMAQLGTGVAGWADRLGVAEVLPRFSGSYSQHSFFGHRFDSCWAK